MAEITDHEAILLLTQKFDGLEKMVRDIKAGQDKFHQESKADMILL